MARRTTRKDRSLALPQRAAPLNGRARQNIGRSTISVAQAKARLISDLQPVSVSSSRASSRAARSEVASSVSVAAKPAAKRAAAPAHDARPSISMEKRPALCKARPRSNRGSGGSRPFVPWCG